MKETVKKAVLPRPNNQGIPLAVQASGAVVVMLLAFGLFAVASFHGSVVKKYAGDNYAAVVSAVLIDQTNNERAEMGLSQLVPSATLTASAQMKADDMADRSYFAHTSPTGLSPWYWFEQAGYNFQTAGENLAVNFRDSSSVTRAWMNSPTHRDNVVNRNYQEIGIATASGQYKGRNTTYVAQHFGSRINPENNRLWEYSINNEQVTREEVALSEAEDLLAAIGQVGYLDRLMVQPDKIYLGLYGLLLLLIAAIGFNAYTKSSSRASEKQIVINTAMVMAVIVALGLATLQLLNTGIIAGTSILF